MKYLAALLGITLHGALCAQVPGPDKMKTWTHGETTWVKGPTGTHREIYRGDSLTDTWLDTTGKVVREQMWTFKGDTVIAHDAHGYNGVLPPSDVQKVILLRRRNYIEQAKTDALLRLVSPKPPS
jgi:hypothetical protein